MAALEDIISSVTALLSTEWYNEKNIKKTLMIDKSSQDNKNILNSRP